MALLEEYVEVSVRSNNREHYISKGYPISEETKTLLVSTRDLPRRSSLLVTPICDNCGKISKRKRKYCHVFRDRIYGKDFCTQCLYDIDVVADLGDKESYGEKAVRKWLENNSIPYRTQVRRKGVTGISGGPLIFDFAVINEDNEPVAFIEYDGEQHYRPVVFEGDDPTKAEIKLAYQQEHDRRKDRYCESIGVPMIRIKYDVPLEEIGRELDRVKEVLRCA